MSLLVVFEVACCGETLFALGTLERLQPQVVHHVTLHVRFGRHLLLTNQTLEGFAIAALNGLKALVNSLTVFVSKLGSNWSSSCVFLASGDSLD